MSIEQLGFFPYKISSELEEICNNDILSVLKKKIQNNFLYLPDRFVSKFNKNVL
jgi:hypothetical protein